MEKFEYITFDLLFSIAPLILIFWCHRKQIRKHVLFVFIATVIGICWAILGDILGTGWGAWEYTQSKILGIRIGSGTLETLIWGTMLFAIFAGIILIFAEKEEKKKSFWPFI